MIIIFVKSAVYEKVRVLFTRKTDAFFPPEIEQLSLMVLSFSVWYLGRPYRPWSAHSARRDDFAFAPFPCHGSDPR